MIASVQSVGTFADDATTISLATSGNVTAGNLLVIYVAKYSPNAGDVFQIGDISKIAGTATLGTFTLDVEHNLDVLGGGVFAAVYSVPITGSGSCTIQIAAADAGSYLLLALQELSGADTTGSRVAGTNENTGNSVAIDSGNVASGTGGIFCGCSVTGATTGHTFTPDGAFTTVYELESIDHVTGSAIYRIVSSNTTDSASWSISVAYPWVGVLAVYKESGISLPTVTTQAVTDITETTATGNGDITATGGENATNRGVVWSTSSHGDPGNVAPGSSGYESSNNQSGSFGTGAFTRSLTGLSDNTTYYVRAYAGNSAGYDYGSEVSFTTDETPAVLTQTAYQFYADDDVEGDATALAAENTAVNHLIDSPFRARLQVDVTNDPAGRTFNLQYRKWNGSSWDAWTDVLTDNIMLLEVSAVNPRYVVNQNGDPVLLTGFHTWSDVQDAGTTDPPDAFDWDEYLTALTSRGLNFTKLWTFESPRGWGRYRLLNRYARTGPGNAADGKLKFDLTQLETDYLDRLESRVQDCLAAGIYCCIQLFQGWDIVEKDGGIENPAPYHPFLPGNNINSVDGDTNDNGDLEETHILASNPVITYQEDFITAVIDRLNQYPNIFYEVSNESTGSTGNTNWQNHVIDYIKTYEASLPYQHLVMFSLQYPSGNNATLDASDADLVSYNNRDETDGTKVSMSDTDHIEGLTDQFLWVWTSLCNGHGGLWYMDQWDGRGFGSDTRANSTYNLIRDNLGYASDLIELLNDLEGMTPQGALTTTGLCLAKDHATQAEYIVSYNGVSTFGLDLSTATGTLNIRWLRCSTGEIDTDTVAGGANRTLTPPWTGAVVAYVYH